MRFGRMVALLFITFSFCQQDDLKVEIVFDADYGWATRILISGEVKSDTEYLGISLYPYNTIDIYMGGRHTQETLPKGEFSRVIQIDQPLLGGSFEVALWKNKVDKIDCTLDYCHWCKVNGFHFDELISYKSGLLNQISGYRQ
jgi:hypothetical protein